MRLGITFVAASASLLPVPTSGCGQCDAVCVPSLLASADLVLPDATDRMLAIDACIGTDCVPLQLAVQNGGASCHETTPTGQIICLPRRIDATHVALQVQWIRRSPTVGDAVTALVTDTATSTVLLDAAGTVAVVSPKQICGTHCRDAEVVLTALP